MIGRKCEVYQDPVLKNDYEGSAIIKGYEGHNEGTRFYCSVEFDNEPGEQYYRWINLEDIENQEN
jgi:hypothetical protein